MPIGASTPSLGWFPPDALVVDRLAMVVLPPVAPVTGTTVGTRLGRDYYVSLGGNTYCVHPEVLGRMNTVRASLDPIVAYCGDRCVADHARLWGTAGLLSDREHVAAAAILREQFRTRPAAGAHLHAEVEVADLSAYDTLLSLIHI